MKILRTARLGSNFTGSYKKSTIEKKLLTKKKSNIKKDLQTMKDMFSITKPNFMKMI